MFSPPESQAIQLDNSSLLAKLQSIDLAETTGNTHHQSMQELLQKISEYKRIRKFQMMEKSQLVSSSSNKQMNSCKLPSPSIKNVSNTNHKKKVVTTRPHSVDSFRLPPPKWDNAMGMSYELSKLLHRKADRDPSGKFIRYITRDEAKGVTVWNPPIEFDRNFPPVSSELSSLSYRADLFQHIDELIDKTEKDYRQLPDNTDRLRSYKALVGRDLYNLQQTRERAVSPSMSRGSIRSPSRSPSRNFSKTTLPSPSQTNSMKQSRK